MTRLKYETVAGYFSEGMAFEQLSEHLKLAAEAAYAIGHHRKENQHALSGDGLLQVGQNLEKMQKLVTQLMTGKLN